MIKKFDTYIKENNDYKESLKDKFPIGTIVKIKPGQLSLYDSMNDNVKNALDYKIGKVVGYHVMTPSMLIQFDVETAQEINNILNKNAFPIPLLHNADGKFTENRYRFFGERYLEIVNEELSDELRTKMRRKEEERKRRKEELRIKMRDIDPYSEDEWEE